MSEDIFGMGVQSLTLKATLLGKIAAWNELAKWMAENNVSYYPKNSLVDLIIEKTDELNAKFTGEDSE